MLRLLIDQDLDHVILRGLLLRVPNADVITAHQVGLCGAVEQALGADSPVGGEVSYEVLSLFQLTTCL